MILDMIRDESRISPERVCIDHVEEHTIRLALDAGHWVGMTLYPITKCTPARAADMIEMYGPNGSWSTRPATGATATRWRSLS